MDLFEYKNGELNCEGVSIAEIAELSGTPAYIYSKGTVLHHYGQVKSAFSELDPLICYSVKANSNMEMLRVLGGAGSGFDIVSGGELYRLLRAEQSVEKVVFAGVGKTRQEMEFALKEGIFAFTVESVPEMELLSAIASELGKTASVFLRVNPDVDPHTHAYTTTGKAANKFGIEMDKAPGIAGQIQQDENLRFLGFHIHIGSQLTEVEPYRTAVEKVLALTETCRAQGIDAEWLDLGGGFGIFYKGDEAKSVQEFADAVLPLLKKSGLKIAMEPGRFIVGNAGILVTRVLYVKHSGGKTFVICDAAMNDLIRPALYQAYHKIWPVSPREGNEIVVDIVGPICESGDFFAKDRGLPPVEPGDLLAIHSTGAYCMAMSSNFNSRVRACEVVVDGEAWEITRRRETYDDLLRTEI